MMQKHDKKSSAHYAQKTAILGLMAAFGVTLSYFEGLIPAMPFLPPGAKLGLSNIATMFCVATFGLPSGIVVSVIKSLFVLVVRGFTAFLMSFFAGVLSVVVMWLLLKPRLKMGLVGVGVGGAVTHNTVQLMASAVITRTASVFYYYPLLIIFAVAAGTVTGIILKIILPALKRIDFSRDT